MSLRRSRSRAESRLLAPVLIADDTSRTGTEGVIERVHRLGRRVEVWLLLSDGGNGVARLDVHDWNWLELRSGDIVAVRRVRGDSARHPRFRIVRQRRDAPG
jgi:hypothetical protein